MLYGRYWMIRERPTLVDRTTPTAPRQMQGLSNQSSERASQHAEQIVGAESSTNAGTVKPELRESFAACRTDCGSWKLKKYRSTATLTTPRCCPVPSRPYTTIPEVKQPLTSPWCLPMAQPPSKTRNQDKMGRALQPTPKPAIHCIEVFALQQMPQKPLL